MVQDSIQGQMDFNDKVLAQRYALFKAHIVDQMADNGNGQSLLSKPLIVISLLQKQQNLKEEQAYYQSNQTPQSKLMCLCLISEIETIDSLINHHIGQYQEEIRALQENQISLSVSQVADQNRLNEALLCCLEHFDTST